MPAESGLLGQEGDYHMCLRTSLLAFLFLAVCTGSPLAQDYAPDQIIVKGATQIQLTGLSGIGVKSVRSVGRAGDQLVTLKPGITVRAAVTHLQKLPNVEYA